MTLHAGCHRSFAVNVTAPTMIPAPTPMEDKVSTLVWNLRLGPPCRQIPTGGDPVAMHLPRRDVGGAVPSPRLH